MSDRPVGIHITSDPDVTDVEQPDPGEARPAVELPLRLLLAADLVPQQDVEWANTSHVRGVDKDRFPALLRELSPRLEVEVSNRIDGKPQLLDVELSFTSLDDFRPEGIARQIPSLDRMVHVRDLVRQIRSQDIDLSTFRDRAVETGMAARRVDALCEALRPAKGESESKPQRRQSSTSDDDALGRLMGMVDPGDGSEATDEPQPSEMVDSLVGAATGASRPSTRKGAAEALLADLDATIEKQLNEVIGHPTVRQLEAAWRGVKFLVDRIDFRAGIELDVLPVSKPELDEALYHQVLLPEHADDGEHNPVSAIVLGASFGHGTADIELLGDLAETAASLQIPLIGSVDPAFFGVEKHEGLARLPLLWQHLERPEYLAWNKLRAREEAKHVALALPAFLLRYPYGTDHPVDDFRFSEEGRLWGPGSLIVAAAVADSFAHTGSPTHVAGRAVDDLALWRSSSGATPLSTSLPTAKQRELAEIGFVVLTAQNDAASVVHSPSIWRVPSLDTAVATKRARVHASLPSQLFVARAAHVTLMLQHQLREGVSVAEATEEVGRRLRRWLGVEADEAEEAEDADEVVHVEHREDADLPDHDLLAVRLQPPARVVEGGLSLVLAVQVPKQQSDAV